MDDHLAAAGLHAGELRRQGRSGAGRAAGHGGIRSHPPGVRRRPGRVLRSVLAVRGGGVVPDPQGAYVGAAGADGGAVVGGAVADALGRRGFRCADRHPGAAGPRRGPRGARGRAPRARLVPPGGAHAADRRPHGGRGGGRGGRGADARRGDLPLRMALGVRGGGHRGSALGGGVGRQGQRRSAGTAGGPGVRGPFPTGPASTGSRCVPSSARAPSSPPHWAPSRPTG